MSKKRLIGGPWTGEFGWELMSWQGFLRKASVNYQEVIICSFAGREPLYEDFCSNFFPHKIEGQGNCWFAEKFDRVSLEALVQTLHAMGGDLLMPTKYIPINQQTFIKYGNRNSVLHTDVLIHARGVKNSHPDHSWSSARWNTLMESLKSIGTVGAIGTDAL
jgi:hypothetical protein